MMEVMEDDNVWWLNFELLPRQPTPKEKQTMKRKKKKKEKEVANILAWTESKLPFDS